MPRPRPALAGPPAPGSAPGLASRLLAGLAVCLAGLAGAAFAAAPAAPAPAPPPAAPASSGSGVAARSSPAPGPSSSGRAYSPAIARDARAAVETMDLDWFDRDRNRQVPVRVYFPKRAPGPFPVVVFSSGLGAGRGSLEFLGRHLASRGYVSVHVQHPGSDPQAVGAGVDRREAMLKVLRDPQAGVTRLLDLVFALDQIGALAASSPVLHGRIDLKAIAVGGRDLGAWTALAAAGLAHTGANGEEVSLPDPRVKAALLFAELPAVGPQRNRLRFEHVKVPCLHVITPPVVGGQGDAQAAARRLAFDQISGTDQVLVALGPARVAGTPAAAAGGPSAAQAAPAGGQRDAALEEHLQAVVTAFLDAYLRHDAAARSWLTSGGLASWLGDCCSVETRSR